MTTQPPQDPRTMTWVDHQNRYWRIARIAIGTWRLTLYSPPTEMWTWIGDYSSKSAAIDAAYEKDPGS